MQVESQVALPWSSGSWPGLDGSLIGRAEGQWEDRAAQGGQCSLWESQANPEGKNLSKAKEVM